VSTLDAAVVHRTARVDDGVNLHYVEAGQGPLVVLLHGFPAFWYDWREQIPALVAAGFRVVAPDMRGYNLSDKPRGVAAYRTEVLARDVAHLIEACGATRASVVGHDWGAGVAWSFAALYPERLDRLAILNVPHPVTMRRGLQTPGQLRKSWYIFFFQIPWLPEALARRTNYAFVRMALQRDPMRRGAYSAADIERYVEAMARPGALTASINYYRALFRYGSQALRRLRPIEAPVLVIWGERDRYLGRELAAPDPRWVPNARVERLPDASHWSHADQPQRVNELLIAFFRGT
jgi:pimeloyl-ACP methyl ester carboxylesterase